MHFLFVSHQSDQPFPRYGQNSVWPWKNTSEIFRENLQKKIAKNFRCHSHDLGQGHGKVIQYILPDLYILRPKYLKLSSNGFDVTDKSCCGGGRGRRGGNELKTKSHPRPGWINERRFNYDYPFSTQCDHPLWSLAQCTARTRMMAQCEYWFKGSVSKKGNHIVFKYCLLAFI